MLLEWMQTFGIDESLHYMLVITLKQAQSYSHYYKKAMRNTMRNARNMTRGTGTINGTINDQLLISSKHSHLPTFHFHFHFHSNFSNFPGHYILSLGASQMVSGIQVYIASLT